MPTDTLSYEQEIAAFRQAAEDALRAADGWLSVVGLFWLQEGRNSVGAGGEHDVALPEGSAPREVGELVYDGGSAVFHPAAGAALRINGEPAAPRELHPDIPGPPDMVTAGSVTFFLISRAGRLGVRVRDSASPARRDFGGRQWFPARQEYRVEAAFAPYDPPRSVSITNVLGDVEEMPAAGVVTFALGGQELRLEALARAGGGLWLIFRDGTSGRQTYPAARFLYTRPPQGGRVTLDFNRAVSPPCAFTAHATCPLPPQQNRLAIPIEAGERWSASELPPNV